MGDSPAGGSWYSQPASGAVVPSAKRSARWSAVPCMPPLPHMSKTLTTMTLSPALSSLGGTS